MVRKEILNVGPLLLGQEPQEVSQSNVKAVAVVVRVSNLKKIG